MTKQLTLILAIVCTLPLFALEFAIETDHTDAIYKIGEMATFTIKVKEKDGSVPQEGVIDAALDNFGPIVITQKKWNLADGDTFTMKGTLPKPGFLRLRLAAKNTPTRSWSVGFEPEKIEKAARRRKISTLSGPTPSKNWTKTFRKTCSRHCCRNVRKALSISGGSVSRPAITAASMASSPFRKTRRRIKSILSVSAFPRLATAAGPTT